MNFRQEVEHLLEAVDLSEQKDEILRIAVEIEGAVEFIEKKKDAYVDLLAIDRQIPGLGLHNVSERTEDGWLSGCYNVEDRPIFRGIQYVEAHLWSLGLEWLSRQIVTESCYHVEGSLKRRLAVKGNLSVGRILGHRDAQTLDPDLRGILEYLNSAIYNNAKHTIENIELDAHMFSVADALAVYLVCRVLGSRILKGSGITTSQGQLIFD